MNYKELSKITDSVLFRKTITLGNLNDFANLSSSINTDLDIEKVIVLLKGKGVKDGDKLEAVFSKTPADNSILDIEIDDLILSFISVK